MGAVQGLANRIVDRGRKPKDAVFDRGLGVLRQLSDLDRLANSIRIWTEEEIAAKRLPKGLWAVLREAVTFGEFPRSRVAELTGHQERQARTVLKILLDPNLLVSESLKRPVRIGFPASVVERWFLGLYLPSVPEMPPPQAGGMDTERGRLLSEVAEHLERIGWEGSDQVLAVLAGTEDEEVLYVFLEHLPDAENPLDLLVELGLDTADPAPATGLGTARPHP